MRRSALILSLLLSILAVTATPSGGEADAHSLRLGGTPLQLLSAGGRLWLLLCDSGCSGQGKRSIGRVVEVDPVNGRMVASGRLDRPSAIAVGTRGVYATDFWRGTVRRLDPRTLRETANLQLTLPFSITTTTTRDNAYLPEQVVVGDGSVWAASDRGALARVDPRLRRVSAIVRLPFDAFQAITTSPHAVWLSESLLGVYRVSTETNRIVARIPIGPAGARVNPVQLIATPTWLLAVGESTNGGALADHNGLARLDPRRNRIESVTPLLPGQLTAAYGGGSLWVGRVNGHILDEIDPGNGKLVRRLRSRVGVALAFAGGSLWAVFRNGTLQRLPIR